MNRRTGVNEDLEFEGTECVIKLCLLSDQFQVQTPVGYGQEWIMFWFEKRGFVSTNQAVNVPIPH